MSAILALVDDEAFQRRVFDALLTRCLATPGETGDALLQRTRYNRTVVSQPERMRGEGIRMLLPVLMNASVQTAFTSGGADAIPQGDIEYVVEQEIAETLSDLDVLLDPALAIVHARTQSILDDIAGSIAAYVVQALSAPEYSAQTTVGVQLRAWAHRHAGSPSLIQDTAARLAMYVLAERDTLAALSIHGPSALTATTLRVGVARVLPALIPWDLAGTTGGATIQPRAS